MADLNDILEQKGRVPPWQMKSHVLVAAAALQMPSFLAASALTGSLTDTPQNHYDHQLSGYPDHCCGLLGPWECCCHCCQQLLLLVWAGNLGTTEPVHPQVGWGKHNSQQAALPPWTLEQ
jgi:hypothetical protein